MKKKRRRIIVEKGEPKILLEIKNPVVCQWHGNADDLRPVLQFQKEIWLQEFNKTWKKWVRVPKEVDEFLITKKGLFLTGFLDRVLSHLDYKEIPYKITQPDYNIKISPPKVKGIKFRKYQLDGLKLMVKKRRGVWQAPPAAGKTTVMCGLISSILTPAIILTHTKDIFNQTYEKLVKHFETKRYKIGRLGSGHNDPQEITVATIQTMHNLTKQKSNWLALKWGLLILDEAHHCSKFKGQYGKVLSALYSPYRFGFTATAPGEFEDMQRLALEGYLGPIVEKVPYKQLEGRVLAKPVMKFRLVPPNKKMKRMTGKYVDVYKKGIVDNRARNQMIISDAVDLIREGKTVLIMVERVKHGVNLLKLADIAIPNTFAFLHGDTKNEIREEEKEHFEKRKRKGIIATRIWSEGTNITTIGAVLNAVGGESEKAAIQRFGRGMRKTKDKSEVILIDYIDTETSPWFEKHSMKRICYYSEWGWL